MNRRILVVDVGGTTVKLMISAREKRKFESGPAMTPKRLVSGINEIAADWKYDAIALGLPAPISRGRIIKDPKNLVPGWMKFDFRKGLGKPLRIINDAAMQALGSYHGRRMLFLGLGTGLGSTLVWERNVLPLELGDLPYDAGVTIEDRVGKRGLEKFGRKIWQRDVLNAVQQLKIAFIADYVVLGGGNAKLFKTLPEGIQAGRNRNAYRGGIRLWETDARTRRNRWNVIS